jgi:molecular chaperone DnaJ
MVWLVFFGMDVTYGQNTNNTDNEINPSEEELVILFTVAILVVIGIMIYIARDSIMKKKTDYDYKEDLGSKKDRDYEKYHSSWSDDYEGFGRDRETQSETMYDKEFHIESKDGTLPNYYKVLGVKKDATQEEIKEKFRMLAKTIHPDKTKEKDAEARMVEINKAYEVLSDVKKRQKYDGYFKDKDEDIV